jgi:tRNA threonylcarbamoyladenosine biosynthesis protein TsaE
MYAVTHNEEQMIEFGRQLAPVLKPGDLVLLIGDLGAGKTTLSKGIVQALTGVHPDEVASPTFTLIHEFKGRVPVYHLDLYRLETEADVLGIGLDDLFDGKHVLLIEWGERFPALWPKARIEIRIQNVECEDGELRRLSVTRFPETAG